MLSGGCFTGNLIFRGRRSGLDKNAQCNAAAKQYYQPLDRYCLLQLGGNLSAADDCVQETFLRMLEKKDTLDFTGNIRSWLYSTAYRVIK
jgi:DNA-directed RNA polymerase specialized sigma24 family protein